MPTGTGPPVERPAAGQRSRAVAVGTHVGVYLLCTGVVAGYLWPYVRQPATLLPVNTDPRLFSWVLTSVFENLVARPALLLHGNAFYPLGQSLTLAEPLLGPSLLAGPLGRLSGSPVLAYNVTLVLLWGLSGWAMFVLARQAIGRAGPALVAALVFLVAPPRLEYYVEFQVQMLAGVPLALLALVRFIGTRRARYLIVLAAAVALQSVSVWYYAVILAVGLAAATVPAVALDPRPWSGRQLLLIGVAGLGLAVAVAPVAWPYFVTRRELGFSRGLEDVDWSRRADLLTYLTTRRTWLARVVTVDRGAETSLFPGLVALVLAGVGLTALGEGRAARPGAERGLGVLVGLAALAGAVAGGAAVAGVDGFATIRAGPALIGAAIGALGLGLARQVLEGRRRLRAGGPGLGMGPVAAGDWARLAVAVGGVAGLLSLGPEVHAAGRVIGGGPYGWLYPYLLPFQAIRSPVRFGLVVLLSLALLAGLGLARLTHRLPPRIRAGAVALAAALVLLEGGSVTLQYPPAPVGVRPVDAVLGSAPGDVAVLEVPTNTPMVDVDAMLRSLAHGKRLVNGFAGFSPDYLEELSGVLSEHGPPFPTREAEAALRRIHPLRFLVVRTADLPAEARADWEALRAAPPPWLRFRGRFGTDELYELPLLPQQGWVAERWVSYAYLRGRPHLALAVAPSSPEPSAEQWVDVALNGRRVARLGVDAPTRATVRLDRPLHHAAVNVVTLRYGYRRRPWARDARYTIGSTGVRSPSDLRVESRGAEDGSLAVIEVDGVQRAANRRGYNLVALDVDGQVVATGSFDTHGDPAAAQALVDFVRRLAPGTIVIGAVRDEASGRLTEQAVEALRSLGVARNLQGHFREAHAFVGVAGAAPGTALEEGGPAPARLTLGRVEESGPGGLGFELQEFELLADAPG